MLTSPLVVTYNISLAIVTNDVFFPIDIRDFREVLAKNGYQIEPLTKSLPPRPAHFQASGYFARKNEFVVNIETINNQLGLEGSSSERIVEAFNELIDIVEKQIQVNLKSNVKFYESIGSYGIQATESAIKQFGLLTNMIIFNQKIENILSIPTQLFGLKFCPKNAMPNQIEWFNIDVYPDVLQPNKFACNVVFRSKEKDKVDKWVSQDKELIKNIIEVMKLE
jgi:hypothetical protein